MGFIEKASPQSLKKINPRARRKGSTQLKSGF
jgi:hypothetical protein